MKKRMRVFAGPNGSGKSTLVNQFIDEKSKLINLDRHINPDNLNSIDILDFDKYGLTVDEKDFRDSILESPFYKDFNFYIKDIIFINNCFVIPNKNSYIGSTLADFIRDCYAKLGERLFSFETVFSHQSKVNFLKSAKDNGWRVYLYFVSTSDPYINCGRVKERALKGEHDVPRDKIIERYTRSLDNLLPALQHCRRAYIFDNSSAKMQLVAEKKPDNSLILLNEDSIPAWVDEYILSKIK